MGGRREGRNRQRGDDEHVNRERYARHYRLTADFGGQKTVVMAVFGAFFPPEVVGAPGKLVVRPRRTGGITEPVET